ncbi:hypothetical protein LguiB_007323 [Lonicera macranthoides]
MRPGSSSEISPEAMERLKRNGRLKMSEKEATGLLSGVVKLSGFFTSSIVNSKVGKRFFSLLPGEIVLASLDGFRKCGELAVEVTNKGLDDAGHAIGTAWAVFMIRKALNPKSVIKPTTLVKAAAVEKNSAKLK